MMEVARDLCPESSSMPRLLTHRSCDTTARVAWSQEVRGEVFCGRGNLAHSLSTPAGPPVLREPGSFLTPLPRVRLSVQGPPSSTCTHGLRPPLLLVLVLTAATLLLADTLHVDPSGLHFLPAACPSGQHALPESSDSRPASHAPTGLPTARPPPSPHSRHVPFLGPVTLLMSRLEPYLFIVWVVGGLSSH